MKIRRNTLLELKLRQTNLFNKIKFNFVSFSNHNESFLSTFLFKNKITLILNKSYTFKFSKMENHQKICNECKGPLLEDNTPDNRKVS